MNCKHLKSSRWITRLFLLAMTLVLLSAAVVPALAAEGLSMSTDYPGVTVKAGDTVSFNLDFTNYSDGSTVALSVLSIPEGWESYFEGSGSEVSHVYVQNGYMESLVSFDVSVPLETEQGTYEIQLKAEGNGLSSVLTLTLLVNEVELGNSVLSTQYPEQEGTTGTTFSFSSTIQNNTPNEQSYSLTANAPSGWTVTFETDSTQVAAVTVDARSSASVDIAVTPPETVESGTYTIPISATSATETLTDELKIVVTGSYDVTLSTTSGLLSFDAVANKQSTVTLSVTNNGNVDLENLNLTSSAPTGWTVEFSQSTIEKLEAGATVEVAAYVTPSDEAMSGDYEATITVKNSESTDSAEFRISVKTETTWGIVGFLLIAIVACGLWLVFRKYGRR